ncbi:MAG: metallophosphoesterase [Candidatus Cloacimonetes bacterium]|nr:metallophosphoesterase [Candidatus Cloacimonadota bacterium]
MLERKDIFAKRIEKEKNCGRGIYDAVNKTLYIENIPLIYNAFSRFLQITGIYKKWKKNALAVRIRHETWYLKRLPARFEEFRILQISDLHIDSLPELAEILPGMIKSAACDLVVFTGDFRFGIHCPDNKIAALLKVIIEEANKAEYGALGILGNHDYLQYSLDNVEKPGLKLLLNESLKLKRNDDEIMIIGLDDIHYYKTGRLFDFREELQKPGFKLLLVHSPEIYREAALYGIDLYLCGHTHAGQICLPGGIPLISNSRSPLQYNQGRWQYRRVSGYTSAGTGASGLPLRWNCPPEITVHRLKVKK